MAVFIGEMAEEPVNVNEFQELARRALPKMYFDFYNGGADDQYTLKENMEAFHRITLREVATARAAAACNTIMALSFSSTCTVEEVASSCNAVRFFQIYVLSSLSSALVYKRRDLTTMLVQRAERNGFKAMILTVDTPRLGRREADIKNRMISPRLKNFEGLLSTEVASDKGSNLEAFAAETLDPSLCWKDIEWLRSITSLPILIKGVLNAEDAIKAMEIGVAGIVVSNHGARQLDYSPATITVLEQVVRAVGGKIPVLIDGGVRRGTDIFKALALGAQAVLIGRPILYGLAAKGEYGVRRVIEMLKAELELTMALSGCPTLKDITRSHLAAAAAGIVGLVAAEYPELRATPPVVVKQQLVGVSLFPAAGIAAVASAAASVVVVAAAVVVSAAAVTAAVAGAAAVAVVVVVAGSCKGSSLASTLVVPCAPLLFAARD
ncbi:hypothetical protein RHMOL_Rhmol08G0317900 [Rhododendron molle]|uniref:Uncharacterized protein n=1 Tax=Rhododendron molle TaxID=49168 RepID=A0ACC0MVR8_RHOML|nr:hypothetical protein RHMOL_Rhmol08G0317900 [Rhododendron molle]